MLTVAYQTCRRDSRIGWFFDSLRNQTGGEWKGIQVVVVDFYAEESEPRWRSGPEALRVPPNTIWVPPKPSPWQGKHRLTSINYFAAANARNTAICYAPDGHISFVDDLSVLMPEWYDCVKHAMIRPEITLGRYRKVTNLVVKDGVAVSYNEPETGKDSRFQAALGNSLVRCPGNWLYGCSLVAPVEAFLKINGWDQDLDSIGTEDTAAGVMLEKHHYGFVYDQRMLTLESEELHHAEEPFRRIAKGYVPGVSSFREKDAAYAYLALLRRGRKRAPNTFDLRELRQHILNGGQFSTDVQPHHHWCDSQPLSEM